MEISKEYFLSRLANGESINDIGNEIAEMMNAAVAEQEAARKAEAAQKKAVGLKIVDLFREYAALTGNNAMDGQEVTDADLDVLVEALDQTFTLMKELKDAINAIPDEKVPMVHAKLNRAKANAKSDDEVLADFIASLAR